MVMAGCDFIVAEMKDWHNSLVDKLDLVDINVSESNLTLQGITYRQGQGQGHVIHV